MSIRNQCAVLLATLLLAGCNAGSEPAGSEAAAGNADPAASSEAAPAQTSAASQAAAPAAAQGKLPFVTDFETGYQQALSTGKPMLVFFTAEWCHFCHQMADEAFANPRVVNLAERFVCILVDADAQPEVCEKFRIQGYPTVQFLSPRGTPLNRLVGKKPGQQVMAAMQAALQNVAQRNSATTR